MVAGHLSAAPLLLLGIQATMFDFSVPFRRLLKGVLQSL